MRSHAVVVAVCLGSAAAALASPGGGDAVPFTDEAAARGVGYATTQWFNRGQGVAFADLDDDGDPDLVAVGDAKGLVGFFENDGTGHFIDRSATSTVAPILDTSGVTLADYDLDGDLDLYVGRHFTGANVLLRNDGNFQFSDVTAEAGVGDTGNAYGCAWGDIDNDGWMDLYVANRTFETYPVSNRLYRNLGTGAFEEIAVALSVDRADDPTLQAAFFDFDRDGDADLYLATDKGTGCEINGFFNHLFENLGGVFIDITESSGTETCADAMCIAIGDFDTDGEQDLYVTNTPPGNKLLMNQGDGTFVHAEDEAGVQSYAIGWGAVFFDYDNDGQPDIYVCNMDNENRLYHNGPWPCPDVAEEMGVNGEADEDSFGVATADIDDDGDLDLVVQTTGEPLSLFINHEGSNGNSIKFDIIGEGPSRYAVGAIVSVLCDGVWRLREVITGCNYKSQNDLVQHIGVAGATVAQEIRVQWPGGNVRTLNNLPTNETWTLYPVDKLGDGDGDGDRDLDDFFVFRDCFTDDAPGTISPGCEVMDYEGDGDVDLADFDQFLIAYDGIVDDCNENGVPDLREILDGSGTDDDGNGVLDSCEEIIGDLTGDGLVTFADVLVLLADWGETDSPADLNMDGIVDFADLLVLLANWS